MARRCELTGKDVMFGCNVSHSMRHTNRRFDANIQKVTLASEALGRNVRMRIAARTLRTVQKKGGLDAYLIDTQDRDLAEEGLRLKRRVLKSLRG